MNIPIQVWQPYFHTSPFDEVFARDLQRAMAKWQGEDLIWLIPNTQEGVWTTDHRGLTTIERAVCSEELDVISIFHIDEGHRVYPPPGLPQSWRNTLPSAFYKEWLSTLPDLIKGDKYIKMELPHIIDGEVSFETATITLGPGPIVPMIDFKETTKEGFLGSCKMVWPPPGVGAPTPVSIEMESKRFYGSLRYETKTLDEREVEVVIAENDPEMLGFNLWYKWPEPFNKLFSLSGGHDLWLNLAKLHECIRSLEQGEYRKVLREAESMVYRLTSEAESQLLRTWFLPKIAAGEENEILVASESQFNIVGQTIDELQKQDRFNEIVNMNTEVRRVQGWLGYFWWEFYQDMKANVRIRFCKNCGSIIRGGRADREHCSRDENPECYRKRNAEQQRRSRSQK